ncbi:TetR/AcrR family transcriptional regulator [Nocardia bovistercoris]|uniref:TetR/AcrR family transcriptional regulator n=1 Tax=Nocardia bovistercoris TaxID=2785916 RepID=A0A931IAQ3_9NOCA|nr:TetR/AcrR family transcriptional regulator [Nocardia bovistercoris]MBH0776747.1 TetR/AcrR family transcriptional regulator [Nocardia bovistercoris]
MKTTRSYTQSGRAENTIATRARILAAAQELFLDKAFEDVTLAAVAKASGVSHQTVLNHFESKAGVVLGVAEALAAQGDSARNAARPGDIEGAIAALVGDYERIGDANVRWAMSADRFPELAAQMDVARAGHRKWLVAMFGDGLPTEPGDREHYLDVLHAATDVYVWKLLRRDLRRDRAETEKTMADLVAGVLRGITK